MLGTKKGRIRTIYATSVILTIVLVFYVFGSGTSDDGDINQIVPNGRFKFLWNVLSMFTSDGDGYNPEIFFVETSGRHQMMLREGCAIESAARAHPKSNITIYGLTDKMTFGDNMGIKGILASSIPNVYSKMLDIPSLLSETPLSQWFSSGLDRLSDFPVEHLSDALRLALLWKYGGVYMDIDVIVLRPLNDIRNAVGLESVDSANGAILVFDKGNKFLEWCMEDFVTNFRPEIWGHQGPSLLTRVLQKVCHGENLTDFVIEPQKCKGVTILPYRSFYPIHWTKWEELFGLWEGDPGKTVADVYKNSFTLHLWGKFSKTRSTETGSGSVLDVLAKNECPLMYEQMKGWSF